jgi:hypothetical protein
VRVRALTNARSPCFFCKQLDQILQWKCPSERQYVSTHARTHAHAHVNSTERKGVAMMSHGRVSG